MRLTLRTLLAYLDDTLPPAEARQIGLKVAENPPAQELVDRIKRVTRRRGLSTPPTGGEGSPSDPNTVAEYLSDALTAEQVGNVEKTCMESDVHLAEIASCHQILTLVLSEQVRVPPTARKRMYQLVKGRESRPDRKPGNTIPVGGMLIDQRPLAADETEAAFLIGMPAYSRSESWSRIASRLALLAMLLLALGVALWMALPPSTQPQPAEPTSDGIAAVTPPNQKAGLPDEGKKAKPAEKTDTKPAEKVDVEPAEKPDTKPAETDLLVEQLPPPRLPGEPLYPAKNAAALVPPPRADRALIGKLEKPNTVVVRTLPQTDEWARVPPEDPKVFSGDRLVALPGYKPVLQLDPIVSVELWGNLPEFFPQSQVLESSVTPYLPADGFHADLTVHTGRIYITTKQPTGARVRLRFRDQVWDLTLSDDKTEVVLEMLHRLVPGRKSELPGWKTETPQTTVGFAVLKGEALLKTLPHQEPVKLPTGGDVIWDSKVGRPVVRPNPDAEIRKLQTAYLSRYQVYLDASQAKLAQDALDDYARKLTDGGRVRATFDESLQDRAGVPPTQKDVEAARIAVLVFAALGDLPGLADGISDPNRMLLRTTAAEGLRAALARDPQLIEAFRQTLVTKLQIEETQADDTIRLLHGFTDDERVDPATLDRLVEGLSASAVCVRELSFQNLIPYIDPTDRANEPLLRFDAGAEAEYREPAIQAWRKKADEIKKILTEQPPPAVPPTTEKAK